MNLPAFSVRRPVLTTMVTLIVVLLGLVAVSRLQIDLLPSIELPTITVRTDFDGASPEVMERTVTQTIEEILATVPGIEELSSTSSEGRSSVKVTFVWGTDIDAAAADLRATLEDEINELPEDIVRPRVSKFDVDGFPVLVLGVSSDIDPVELTQVVENQIRYRLGRIPGVAQVDMWGGYEREIRVELDPARVRAQGVGLEAIVGALRDANVDRPAGRFERGSSEVILRAPSQYVDVEQIAQTVVAEQDGAVVRIGQLGEVRDTHTRVTRIERINGVRGIRVAIRKQPSANTVEVAHAVLAELDQLNADLPQVQVVAVINQGNFIERSIDNVTWSVIFGGTLAIFVLLFFLRNLRTTVVIGLSIPISILGTFALVYLGGFTLNLMTLGGLALGVGMMVDSSIVVLENIFRRREENGEDAETAAVEGAREVGPAIVASTITTLVIFLPLVFVRGVAGVLFQELAFVIVFSLLCSLGVSLTLVPMLAARLLKPTHDVAAAPSAPAHSWLGDTYAALLESALLRPWTTVGLAGAAFLGSLLLYPWIGTEFLPPSDEGEVRITGEMQPGTRLDLVDRQTQRMEALVLRDVPELESSAVRVQGDEGEIRMTLTRASSRWRSNTEVAEELRQRLEGQVPGMDLRVRAPQGQFLLERVLGSEDGVTIEVRGFDLEVLDGLAKRAAERTRDVPGITDVRVSRRSGVPHQKLVVNRSRIADLGLDVVDVMNLIETAMAGRNAGQFRTEGDSFRIFVQLADAPQRTLDDVLELTLLSDDGELVALRSVVDPLSTTGPSEIARKDQQRVVKVTANVAGRDLGSAARDVSEALASIPRPAGYEIAVAGSIEAQDEAFRELAVSLVLAILLVYMVLASQYESFRDPLVVMLSVPVAAVGVLLTLFATGTTLNLQSWIGCIMLGGIVVNNAILLVDQAAQLVLEGALARQAVAEAGRRRLRPILMTTSTTVLGLIPLALGIGEGADAQAPLARAVVGGLVGSTLITLVLIPVVYTLVHRGDRQA